MLHLFRSIAIIGVVTLTISCHQHTHDEDHHHLGSHEEHTDPQDVHSTTVHLTPDQMQSIDLQLGRVERRNLTSGFKANGFLKVPNQNKATVTALYGGVIRELLVMPGSDVTKGQVIATIVNPRLISMQEEYLGLMPEITEAQRSYQRQQELVGGNAGARKDIQAAEARLESLRIRQVSLKRQLELAGIPGKALAMDHLVTEVPVVTPISGTVSTVMVNLGAHVDPEMPVAEVVDNNRLHLDLFVFEKDLPLVHQGQSIDFILTNRPGKAYSAEVFSVGTTFEHETKAVAVHCVVKGDKKDLIEGMSVTAQLNIAMTEVPALPTGSIVRHAGSHFVFIKEDQTAAGSLQSQQQKQLHTDHEDAQEEAIFRRVPVKKGMTEFGFTQITLLADVAEDAEFVTNGAFFLMATMINAGEAHAH